MRPSIFVLLLVPVLGCGGDASAPTTPATARSLDLAGTWSYDAPNVSGAGIVCAITGMQLTLSHAGTTLTGGSSGGTITCTINGTTRKASLNAQDIANGVAEKRAVEFDLGSTDVHHFGQADATTIVGSVTIRYATGRGPVPISGRFTATRR